MTRIDSLVRLGDATYRTNPDSASRIYSEALVGASATGDSFNIARVLTGLGMVARLNGEWSNSRRYGEQALALKLRFKMSASDQHRSYNALALLEWNQERLGAAEDMLTEALRTAIEAGDSAAIGRVTINAGLVAKDRGAFDRARSSFEAGRDIATATGDSITLGRAYNNLGMLEIALGNPLSALALLEDARRLARATDDNVTEVNARGQLASAYQALGEPQRAFALLDSALTMAEQQGQPTEVAEDLTLIADLYAEAGDYQHALDYYRRALAKTDSLGLPEEEGDILRSMAIAQAGLGNLRVASEQAQEALRLHREAGLLYPELEDLLVVTNLAARRQQFGEAERWVNQAARVAERLDAPIVSAQVAIATADVAAKTGQWQRVLQALDSVRNTLYLAGSVAEADAFSLLAQAQAELGRNDAAIQAGRQALDAIERVRANYGTPELRTTFTTQKSAIFARQALVMLKMGRTEEAFQVADAARGRAISEHLMQARNELQSSGISTVTLQREALLRRIDALVGQLRERERQPPHQRASDFGSVTGSLSDSVDNLRSEYSALLLRTSRSASETERWTQTQSRPGVAHIRTALQPGELLLEYLVTDDRLVVFTVTASSVTAQVIDETASNLTDRVLLAWDLLRRRDFGQHSRSVLRALFEILLGPVVRSGALDRSDNLIIVPHGVLTYLPFAALVDPATNEFLVQRHSLQYLPTSAALTLLPERESHTQSNRLRAEIFAPMPVALSATKVEATNVARALRRGVTYLGTDATERRFRQALSNSGIVHVASHAMLNSRNPMFTFVELARSDRGGTSNNGRLEVHELLGVRSNASLVFLSGCETGVGSAWSTQFDTGEDLATLGQSFLRAGTRNVISTLWRIDDEGAAEFARAFYESISGGYSAALAIAQRRMIDSDRYRSPYYWAPYQLTGSSSSKLSRKTSTHVR